MSDVFIFATRHVEGRQQEYVKSLAAAVAIPSVSADPARRSDCLRMIEHYRAMMAKLGIENETRDLGQQQLKDGGTIPLPPAVLGKYGSDPAKKTVGIYGHLDVQPAKKEDGWNTDPWTLTEIDNKLYGRGSTDDKGPALSWLWIVEAHQELGLELPVNLIFCLEAMEESGSEGLEAMLLTESGSTGYFAPVHCWCISDNSSRVHHKLHTLNDLLEGGRNTSDRTSDHIRDAASAAGRV